MSDTIEKPVIPPYTRHAIMCVGRSCGENMPLLKYAQKQLAAAGLNHRKSLVRMNRAGCLGVCEQGPIMVVYPEGVWYANLDEAKIDQIVEQHFKQGEPVWPLVFHTMIQSENEKR